MPFRCCMGHPHGSGPAAAADQTTHPWHPAAFRLGRAGAWPAVAAAQPAARAPRTSCMYVGPPPPPPPCHSQALWTTSRTACIPPAVRDCTSLPPAPRPKPFFSPPPCWTVTLMQRAASLLRNFGQLLPARHAQCTCHALPGFARFASLPSCSSHGALLAGPAPSAILLRAVFCSCFLPHWSFPAVVLRPPPVP